MKSRIQFYTACFIFILSLTLVTSVQAKKIVHPLPELNRFVESIVNGDANTLRGVYVYGLMAQPVIQQPDENPSFVSQDSEQITQFGMASQAGNVGLLAHNYLVGNKFSELENGEPVILVYGDGHMENFIVTNILQYQALDPDNPHGDFKDLETASFLSTNELFNKVYRGERHVTFQTCIEANGDLSWGRLFVIAEPVDVIPSIRPTYRFTSSWKN